MTPPTEYTTDVTGSGYKVDDRVTVMRPDGGAESSDIFDGPTLTAVSGVRLSEDIYPGSGT